MYLLAILPQLEAVASNSQAGILSSIARTVADFWQPIQQETPYMNASGGSMPEAMWSSAVPGYVWIGGNGSD